ncbi:MULTISPECIES: ABC transporter substrate-binding protein [Microbacterium]|uniref:Leucine-binding protein domain-containing protein n=1 Tax=Microbacterium wangchenii TaxID=2541726 RepID=A0ABX5SZ72_9MICO|nr:MULTISPECIES: ABC transporter substrate-binding protein [Microbacterium]MCK6066149.1 ABC transporter substrate-binding protein [Microbacterium sp. EYE_512]QBR90427.1 hypothetical protein E4K62_18115 [Microbacterium wangchenii]TFV84766.1 hypothetical protein E4V99_06895 [Microbacterium sp. dk485]TXK14452.1 ABC transporter substrate-binding protein [Microbacterium wangchenii]
MKHGKAALALISVPILLAVSGCSGTDAADSDDASGTVSLGVIAPMSGNFAQVGDHISEGFALGVKHAQEDGLAPDVTFEIDVKDDQADAQVAAQSARDFMSDGTMLLGGMLTTPACSAVAPLADQAGGVLITSVCAGNELSGVYADEKPYERTFAVAPRDTMVSDALATVLAEQFPTVTDYNVFGFDYAWGRDTWSGYIDGVKAAGVDAAVNQEYWVPLGETNYRSQVSALSNGLGEPDSSAMFLSTYGAGTTAFLQQAEAFEIVDRVALLASAGGYEPVARGLGGAAPEMWNAYDYAYAAYDNEFNTRFVEEFLEAADERPMAWSYDGYLTGYAYVAAIDAAGSADPDAVVEALAGLEFEGSSGTLRFDPETHQLIAPVVVTQSIGNPDAPEGVEFLETFVVPAEDLIDTH